MYLWTQRRSRRCPQRPCHEGSVAAHVAVGVGAGTLAAVSTVTPSSAGAIDLIVVKQPDGTLRCSPFYVRFGGGLSACS